MKKSSPTEYYRTSVLITYSTGDSVTINDNNGNSWNGSYNTPDMLKCFNGSGFSVVYIYEENVILLLPETSGGELTVTVSSDTECCLAEIDSHNNFTGQTDDFYMFAGKEVKITGNSRQFVVSDETDDNSITVNPNPVITEENVTSASYNNYEPNTEIQRLQKLISQLYDNSYNEVYQQVQDISVNNKMQELYSLKKKLEEKRHSCEALEEEKLSIIKQTDELEERTQTLLNDIASAEELLRNRTETNNQYEKRLNYLCDELGMDIQTLRLYQNEDSIEKLLQKASQISNEVRETLKNRIQLRQQTCRNRHDIITGV